MASNKGIVEIDLDNPTAAKLIIPSDLVFWGITTAAVSSTQNKVYAMAVNHNLTTVYELDLDNKSLGKIVAVLPLVVNDAASYEEDGSASHIEIVEVKQITDCANNGKGTLQIVCREQLDDYKYTLDGVTNNTGIFTNVSAGAHTITVESDVETKTIPFTATFLIEKPELSVVSYQRRQ
jgi:hypothetical protein